MKTLHPPPPTETAAPQQGKAAAPLTNQLQGNATLSKQAGKPINMAALEMEPVTDYYHATSEKFLTRNPSGRWIPRSTDNYKRVLKGRGISALNERSSFLTEVDLEILEVQQENDVSGYGPLCGRNSGFIDELGTRYLVTENMNLIEPVEGEFPVIRAILNGLLSDSESKEIGSAQLETLLGWMQSSVVALRSGRYQQQQAIAICGSADCGKSLIQHKVITPSLAGRSTDAKRVLLDGNDFNSNLYKAEHLFLDDCQSSNKLAKRQALGSAIKRVCVGNAAGGLHAKGKDEITVQPWWRLSITLNNDLEELQILPPLDRNFQDKLILLRASRFDFPMPNETGAEKAIFDAKILGEIPAFLYYLIHTHTVSPAYADPRRYNVLTFHHPELKEDLQQLSPEAELLELIDITFRHDLENGPLWLSAEKIQERITSNCQRRAELIFTGRGMCARYLARLAGNYPKRIAHKAKSDGKGWIIRPKYDGNDGYDT